MYEPRLERIRETPGRVWIVSATIGTLQCERVGRPGEMCCNGHLMICEKCIDILGQVHAHREEGLDKSNDIRSQSNEITKNIEDSQDLHSPQSEFEPGEEKHSFEQNCGSIECM